MGYTDTFLSVAGDCRAVTGEVPRAGRSPSVAATQYAMLAAAPARWTQEDVLLASSPEVRGREVGPDELERLRAAYFAQPRACLRASPLPKTHGWGLHFDAEGRVTLHAVDSPDYARLEADPALTRLRAMRSSRAR